MHARWSHEENRALFVHAAGEALMGGFPSWLKNLLGNNHAKLMRRVARSVGRRDTGGRAGNRPLRTDSTRRTRSSFREALLPSLATDRRSATMDGSAPFIPIWGETHGPNASRSRLVPTSRPGSNGCSARRKSPAHSTLTTRSPMRPPRCVRSSTR